MALRLIFVGLWLAERFAKLGKPDDCLLRQWPACDYIEMSPLR